ncbi:branched-chain amino acid ABC transporter permease [Cryptosporangium phraense]|uniref:Branched-chain amino acid ABC transporter permease n=1 Tax=Cryptosporangium phraense TaxID=2593070 RepID=A0A545AG01_9ACTN|nr:branched-chain amino acid ABC transporter permease [Cryptosporangium phraense]TQS40249.1 branched-chain amino acid ABC transporter permease [Cryptosporangium phraense]
MDSRVIDEARAGGARRASEVSSPRRVNTLLRHLVIAVVVGVVVVCATYQISPFRNYQLATVAAYLCVLPGLIVLTGFNGQISLGHGALMAAGAYPVALSQNLLGGDAWWHLPVSILAGVVVAVLVGAVIGVAAARLHGPYLAGATLAVAVSVPAVATTFDGVFGGDAGLSFALAPAPSSLGAYFPFERWQAWVALLGAGIVMLLLANLVRSRYGRTFRAVRDDEVAAALAGIHVGRARVLAFVVSAAGAGLGGAMFAVLAQSVSPGAYGLTLSLNLVLAVVLGGLGGLRGAVWGAVALVALQPVADAATGWLDLGAAASQRLEGTLPLAVFGLALIVVMTTAPGGLDALVTRILRR